MPKVLGQAGTSLADVYDVEGSIAGVDTLLSKDVALVHEMGATIFSERVSSTVRRRVTAALAQDTDFDHLLTDLPSGATRLGPILMLGSFSAARLSFASVAVRDQLSGREVPVWSWDSTVDEEVSIRVSDDGAAAATFIMYRPIRQVFTPGMLIGEGQPQRVSDIAFRGRTLGFGAGTQLITLAFQVLFSQVGGLDSKGLPLPSW